MGRFFVPHPSKKLKLALTKVFSIFKVMEPNNLAFKIQLTEKDYLKFLWTHSGLTRARKWLVIGCMMLFVYGCVIIPQVIWNGFKGVPLSVFLPLMIMFFILIAGYVLIIYRSKMLFKNDPFINHPYEINFTEGGLTLNAYRSSLNPVWKDIFRYHITDHAIYIYLSEQKAIIIPARYITNDTDNSTLRELLKSKVDTSNYQLQKKKTRSAKTIYYLILAGLFCFIAFKDCGNGWVNNANKMKHNNTYAESKKIYSELIEAAPNFADHYLERAKCEIYLMEYSNAISDCEKAIKLNHRNGKAYFYYAYALYNNRQYDATCKAINKAIELGYTDSTDNLCEGNNNQMDSLYFPEQ